MDINFVAIKGRMTCDAKLVPGRTGNLLIIKLATNHGQGEKRKVTYHCVMYYPQTESEEKFLHEHLRTGVTAHVTGNLGNYKDSNGVDTTFIRGQTINVLSFLEDTASDKVDDEEEEIGRALAVLERPAPNRGAPARQEPPRQAPAVAVATKAEPARATATLQREAGVEVQF